MTDMNGAVCPSGSTMLSPEGICVGHSNSTTHGGPEMPAMGPGSPECDAATLVWFDLTEDGQKRCDTDHAQC